jgi:predicted nucleic acid-binding protein
LSAYADTSFLASLYAPDAKSVEVSRLMQRVELPMLLTRFGELELENALHLRVFRKQALPYELREARAAIRADVGNGVLVMTPLPDAIYLDSKRLASAWTAKLGTRTLDIIHVASALALKADLFYTFDERQAKLARAVGLRTAQH